MYKKLGKIIIIFVLLIIIVISIIINLLKNNNKNGANETEQINQIEQETVDEQFSKQEILDYSFYKVVNEEDYIAVEKSINSYFLAFKERNIDNIFKLLNKEFLNKNSIDRNNILSKIKGYLDFNNFFIDELYFKVEDSLNEEEVGIYYIYGTVWNNDYKSHENVLLQLNVNLTDNIINIIPYEISELNGQSFKEWITKMQNQYVDNINNEKKEENNQNQSTNEEEFFGDEKYEDNESENVEQQNTEIDNLYSYVDKNLIVKRVLSKIVVNSIYNNGIQEAYNLLTDECKSKYFSNINDFSEFINKYKDSLLNLQITNTEYQESDSGQYHHLYRFSSGNTIKFYIYLNDITDYKIAITK